MKIFVNKLKESWIIDRVTTEWKENNESISTNKLKEADIIWIIASWVWKKTPKKYLKNKKVLSSVYHIDFNNFDSKQKEDFYELDKYVDVYHVISQKTKHQLRQLTDKQIISIPFWINQKNWFYIEDKVKLKESLGFKQDMYLVGSFQRDTEGGDLTSPKLIKGPDIFIDIVKDLNDKIKNLTVLLAGTRRQYVLKELEEAKINYKYYEMADLEMLNKLYNVLDLYLVTSRIEGGPQAILESAITKTPIISTDVGVASEVLHEDSLFKPGNFDSAKPDIDYAYKNSLKYKIPEGMNEFRIMFKELYES